MTKKFDYEGARQAGYSDEEIMFHLAEAHPDFDIPKAKESGYSPSEINQYLASYKSPRNPIQKAGRLASQYAIGAAEQAAFPLDIPQYAIKGLYETPGAKEAVTKQNAAQMMEFLSESNIGKDKEQWSPEDQEKFDYFQKIMQAPQEELKELNTDVPTFTSGELIHKAFEKAGIDISPDGLAESAVRWMGFIKDPKKAFNLTKAGIDIMQRPQRWKEIAKAAFPSVKEASRGFGAAVAMEIAADNEWGPIGSLTAAVVGDVIGHQLPGLGKGTAKFATHPIRSTKEALARGAASMGRWTQPEKLRFQQDLIKQFREAGIQADLGSITGSNLMKAIQARLSQSGLVGSALDDFRNQLTQQIVGEYKQLAEGLGEFRFQSLHDAGESMQRELGNARKVDKTEINKIYDEALERAKFSWVSPDKLARKVDELEQKLSPGAVKGTQQQSVLQILKDLKKDILDENGAIQDVPLAKLINNKIALNDIIDYEALGGAKQLLKDIVKELDNTILQEESPKFRELWKEANSRFARHAATYGNKDIAGILRGNDPSSFISKMGTVQGVRRLERALSKTHEGKKIFNDLKRTKFEQIVMDNMVDGATEQLKMGKFSNILQKGKNREIIREILGTENFVRLERLQKSSGILAESAQKFLNASKSGAVAVDAAVIAKGIGDLVSLFTGNPWPLVRTSAGVTAARALSKMITDPVFLKMVEEGMLAGKAGNTAKMKQYFNYIGRPILGEDLYPTETKIPSSKLTPEQASTGRMQTTREKAGLFEPQPLQVQRPGLEEDITQINPNYGTQNIPAYLKEPPMPFAKEIEETLNKLSTDQIKVYKNSWDDFLSPDFKEIYYKDATAERPYVDQELGTLKDWLKDGKHKKLLEKVGDIPINIKTTRSPGNVGYFDIVDNTITIRPNLPPEAIKSVLFHEGYHALQAFIGKIRWDDYTSQLIRKYPTRKYPAPRNQRESYYQKPEEIGARKFQRAATKKDRKRQMETIKTQKINPKT